jgi:DNA-binding transcriptional LysR family regulator
MELRQLNQFVAVAEALSFRRAAERLHMAQPPLSVAIRKLEDELGAELFERRGRTIRLTEAGHEALRTARKCLADAAEIRTAARSAAQGDVGRLRMGFVGSATYSLLPKLLPAFRKRYPRIELELRESTNQEMLELIEAERLDAGLVRVPTTAGDALQLEVIERDVFHAVMPKRHPLAAARSVTLRALAEGPLIGYAHTKVPGLHAVAMFAFQHAALSPRAVQEATQVQTVLCLVESGLGVALVPSVSARFAPKGLVFRPVRDLPAAASIGIALAFHRNAAKAATTRLCEVAVSMARGDL